MGTFRQAQHKRSRDWTQVSCIAGKFFTIWVIREVQHSGPYMQRKQNRHYEQITKCIYTRIRSKIFQRYFQLLLPLSNTLSELPYCFQYFSIFSINIYSTLSICPKGFPRSSVVKNLPATQETQETWVSSLDQRHPPEEEMTTHDSILA